MIDHPASTDALIREMLEERARHADTNGLLEAVTKGVAATGQRSPRGLTRSIRGLAAIAAVVVVAVAVGTFLTRPSVPVGPASPSPEASPSPSLSLSPSPSASASAAQPIAPAGLDTPTLSAGRWSTVAFEPGLEFTAPADRWAPGLDVPQQLYLRARLPEAPADEFNAVTLVRVVDVFRDPCGVGSGTGDIEPWPVTGFTSFLDWVRSESSVDLGPLSTTSVLGQPAEQIELEVPEGAYSECVSGYLPLVEIDGGPSGEIGIPRIGQRFRFATFELDGGTYVLVTFGAPERWDALVAATDQLLASMTVR